MFNYSRPVRALSLVGCNACALHNWAAFLRHFLRKLPSADDADFWHENVYVIVHEAASLETCKWWSMLAGDSRTGLGRAAHTMPAVQQSLLNLGSVR